MLLWAINLLILALAGVASASILAAGFSKYPDDLLIQVSIVVVFSVMLINSASAALACRGDRFATASKQLIVQFLAFWVAFFVLLYLAGFR